MSNKFEHTQTRHSVPTLPTISSGIKLPHSVVTGDADNSGTNSEVPHYAAVPSLPQEPLLPTLPAPPAPLEIPEFLHSQRPQMPGIDDTVNQNNSAIVSTVEAENPSTNVPRTVGTPIAAPGSLQPDSLPVWTPTPVAEPIRPETLPSDSLPVWRPDSKLHSDTNENSIVSTQTDPKASFHLPSRANISTPHSNNNLSPLPVPPPGLPPAIPSMVAPSQTTEPMLSPPPLMESRNPPATLGAGLLPPPNANLSATNFPLPPPSHYPSRVAAPLGSHINNQNVPVSNPTPQQALFSRLTADSTSKSQYLSSSIIATNDERIKKEVIIGAIFTLFIIIFTIMQLLEIISILVPLGIIISQFIKPELLHSRLENSEIFNIESTIEKTDKYSQVTVGLIVAGYALPLIFVILSLFEWVNYDDHFGYFVFIGATLFVFGITLVLRTVAKPVMIFTALPFVALFEFLYSLRTKDKYPGFGKSLIVHGSVMLFFSIAALLAASDGAGVLNDIGYWLTHATTILMLNILEIGTFLIMVLLTGIVVMGNDNSSDDDIGLRLFLGLIVFALTAPSVYISTYLSEAYIIFGGIETNHLLIHGLTADWFAPSIDDLNWLKVFTESLGTKTIFFLAWIKVFIISVVIFLDELI